MENAKCYAPQILVGTEGLPREQWLEYRRKGIGGSDAAAVLGISPFRTGRDLYYDKLNIVTADDAENWVQLEVGTLLEPLVAKIFAHKTGYKIYRRPFMFQHPLYPWMLADLDYMVELPDGTTAILEIKTTNYSLRRRDPGSVDSVPCSYPRTRNQSKVVFHHIAQIFHRDLILFRDTALAYDLPIAQCTAASLIP